MLALISDIVDLAKIESGQLPLVYGKLKVSELMGELEQYAHEEMGRHENKKIDLVIQHGQNDIELETDVIRINQIMKNLINNAIKFTEKGSVTLGAKTEAERDRIVFQVRDTGIGIDSDHFGLIFEQFRQVDGSDTRKFGGTGLGLTICRKLVELMHGRIWVESASGEGAAFHVELPMKQSGNTGQFNPNTSYASSGSTLDGDQYIMVVDDEPDSAELMEELILSLGHRVVKSHNGFEALQYLERLSLPDIVMMDVEMSVLSGTDVLRIIKERYPQIRVVAQSAHALHGDRKRFLDAGFDEYLPKPFSKKQMADILDALSLP